MAIQFVKKKFLLTLFLWVTILCVVENPLFSPMNLVVGSTQVVAAAPTSGNGVSLQGSMIVMQTTSQVQAINQTSGQTVQAYQVSVAGFNFMTVFILLLPWVLYAYWAAAPASETLFAGPGKRSAQSRRRAEKADQPAED